jgi:hypothetical protein
MASPLVNADRGQDAHEMVNWLHKTRGHVWLHDGMDHFILQRMSEQHTKRFSGKPLANAPRGAQHDACCS